MELEQSTDFMYSLDENNHLMLRKFKGAVAMTVFNNKDYQVFYTELGNYVYTKADEKVYNLTNDGWTRMVLSLESVIKPSVLRYDYLTHRKTQQDESTR